MDRLSQELVDHISGYLSRGDLKNTLLLSRKFQYAAERYSEAFSNFDLTWEENATKFLSIYSNYRFRYLRTVSFETTVPAINTEEDAEEDCRDTPNELEVMDEMFTRQLHYLFFILHTLENRVSKVFGPGRIHLTIFTPTRDLFVDECYHRMFTSWRVHLLSPWTLPSLTSIRSLNFDASNARYSYDQYGPNVSLRKIDQRILLDLATKCPNLETLQCRMGGDEWFSGFSSPAMSNSCQDWAGPRRDSRQDFCKALHTMPSLRHVQLDFLWPIDTVDNIDQRLALPDLVAPAIYDTFSTSLRLLSQNLRTMSLRVCADETLFWPNDDNSNAPFWPNMESLNIMFHMSKPSGAWYFRGLPGVGSNDGFHVTDHHYPPYAPTDQDYADDYDDANVYMDWDDTAASFSWCQFRVEPNEDMLVPFLTAFAKAAARMPSLKEFALWSPLRLGRWEKLAGYENFDASLVYKHVKEDDDLDLAWGIAYTVPGEQDFTTFRRGDYSPSRRLWWRVGKWRPNSALHDLFQNIGREKHGNEVIEKWNDVGIEYHSKDVNCGEGLDHRDFFTEWESSRWTIDPDS
ncbi:hypothetical protein K504DRAFT_459648 [Pleomassaria siparia CBS 279.74]|uniref:F-box domain-containing protein n=1 Tax=Pleomassaria siparia CBS 279.74 TaxID=1314801 RepID=A0A6G1K170_9PLEO|nr:hypothetical protein K504DRAFT_459648 [Pleomassaria siparia CBS 279.74]